MNGNFIVVNNIEDVVLKDLDIGDQIIKLNKKVNINDEVISYFTYTLTGIYYDCVYTFHVMTTKTTSHRINIHNKIETVIEKNSVNFQNNAINVANSSSEDEQTFVLLDKEMNIFIDVEFNLFKHQFKNIISEQHEVNQMNMYTTIINDLKMSQCSIKSQNKEFSYINFSDEVNIVNYMFGIRLNCLDIVMNFDNHISKDHLQWEKQLSLIITSPEMKNPIQVYLNKIDTIINRLNKIHELANNDTFKTICDILQISSFDLHTILFNKELQNKLMSYFINPISIMFGGSLDQNIIQRFFNPVYENTNTGLKAYISHFSDKSGITTNAIHMNLIEERIIKALDYYHNMNPNISVNPISGEVKYNFKKHNNDVIYSDSESLIIRDGVIQRIYIKKCNYWIFANNEEINEIIDRYKTFQTIIN